MVGDSLGLPYEGLPAGRNLQLMPFPLRQRIFFGRGFTSDDTLQSAMVLSALSECEGEVDRFVTLFGRSLRLWFLSLPPGIGLSTAKACLKLCAGVNPTRPGVKSEGNGAAMRSAVIGAALCEDQASRVRFLEACARVTHSSDRAIEGAQLIALAASLSATGEVEHFVTRSRELCPAWPFDAGWPDRGPSGWVVHSVNAALRIWREFGSDPSRAMEETIRLGGDTDTVAAMVGGIIGASPMTVWPGEWLKVWGWNDGRLSYGRMLGQHAVQLPVILGYGFRRLLPPYR